MATRMIELTAEQDALVEKVVKSGRYRDAGEVVRDALRDWQDRHEENALKLDLLRTHVRKGVDELDRGASVEVNEADLDEGLDRLVESYGR